MKFDSNLAWNQAVASINAGRNVIWPVAGVFFLVPSLIWVWFFNDVQMAMMANLSSPAGAERALDGLGGKAIVYILLMVLIQSVGNMSVLGLFTTRSRQTVGEAIRDALASLPTVIGALVLMMLGYVLIGAMLAMVAGVLMTLLHSKLVNAVVVVAALAVLAYVMTKLSLLTPVIILERQRNPVAALRRTWAMTRGNSARLFLFYLLLAIGYFVIAIVLQMVLGAFTGVSLAAAGGGVSGSLAMTVQGLVSGLLGMVAAVVLNAILASIHRQLSGAEAPAGYGDFNF